MDKQQCKLQMNACLKRALKEYHAASGLSQETLAEQMQITPRAFSALENGGNGFSAYTAFALLSALPPQKGVALFFELCGIFARSLQDIA